MSIPKISPMLIMAIDYCVAALDTPDEDEAFGHLDEVLAVLDMTEDEAFDMYEGVVKEREKAVRDL